MDIVFSTDSFSINGYMVSVLFATKVAAGKKENTLITIFDSDLELNGITEIENIEFELRIYNAGDLVNGTIVRDTYTVNFK